MSRTVLEVAFDRAVGPLSPGCRGPSRGTRLVRVPSAYYEFTECESMDREGAPAGGQYPDSVSLASVMKRLLRDNPIIAELVARNWIVRSMDSVQHLRLLLAYVDGLPSAHRSPTVESPMTIVIDRARFLDAGEQAIDEESLTTRVPQEDRPR